MQSNSKQIYNEQIHQKKFKAKCETNKVEPERVIKRKVIGFGTKFITNQE